MLIFTLYVSAISEKPQPIQYIDPAMIGVLVGMALMFVIICVVLRLFSRSVDLFICDGRPSLSSIPKVNSKDFMTSKQRNHHKKSLN